MTREAPIAIKFGDLKVGEQGRIAGFEPGDVAHRQKLLSMGLTPGAEVTVLRVAPLGDPIEVRVRGVDLSLRSDEASALLIERVAREAKVTARTDTRMIGIAGNPNCGKTTLFNGLTGTHQRVGNWGGVTVEKKEGEFEFADQRFRLVDLPGINSLDTYDETTSIDERITRDYILSGEADLILNVVDASHLESSLYLTTQLLEMSAPVAVILNVMDDVDACDAQLDVDDIQRRLGCPVTAIVATRHKHVESLKADIKQWIDAPTSSRFSIDYPPPIEKAISELSLSIRGSSTIDRLDDRWLALRLLEGDSFAKSRVAPEVKQLYAQLTSGILEQFGDEADTIIANSRYQFAHVIAEKALPKRVATGSNASDRIDRIALNRFLGIPIFLGVMYCLFWFTVQLSRAFRPFFVLVSEALFVEGPRHLLGMINTPAWITALVADGLGNGLLQVVTFIPIIGFLYLFVSALEESGYMARANFVMDRLMKSLGLPGNAFIPMVVGFGCNVPAIMATRTMERPRDRIVAVLMSPFMSCGGRLAVYTVFAAAFFPERGQFVIFGFYLLGIVFAMITSLFMKFSLLPEERSLHVLTLPAYHWPKPRNVLINTWIRLKMFLVRVGKFIIPLVFLVKVLSAWGTDGSFNQQPIDQSMLAAGGRAITPVLTPMGVKEDNWPATVALFTGALHKVVIVTTLSSIYMEQAKQLAPLVAEQPKESSTDVEPQHSGAATAKSPPQPTEAQRTAAEDERQISGHDIGQGDQANARPASATTTHLGDAPRDESDRAVVSTEETKGLITLLWRRTTTARAFAIAVAETKWTLAMGNRRNFVLIDPRGDTHALERSLEGVSARAIRARMNKLDPASLPSMDEAQAKVRAVLVAEQARRTERVQTTAPGQPPDAGRIGEQEPAKTERMSPVVTEHAPPEKRGSFNLLASLSRAAMTVPQNLKALVGIGAPVRMHSASANLAPALATKFDGKLGALAYLILLLCYPCIATTAATARETNRRWTGFMIFWTISLGYGAAVLFYQTGTFALHPISSGAWILGVVVYFIVLGTATFYVGPRSQAIAANSDASTIGSR